MNCPNCNHFVDNPPNIILNEGLRLIGMCSACGSLSWVTKNNIETIVGEELQAIKNSKDYPSFASQFKGVQ